MIFSRLENLVLQTAEVVEQLANMGGAATSLRPLGDGWFPYETTTIKGW